MNTIRSNQSIGEIVSIIPKASGIFKDYKIDFCCGGNRPLIEAIKEQKLNEGEIISKLNKAFEDNKEIRNNVMDFREMSNSELIEYIVTTHHVYLKRALPELGELTTKIMRVHGVNHEELFRVHKLFSILKAELEQHLLKEEELLFPMIKQYDTKSSIELLAKIKNTVKETEEEHEAAGGVLKELRKITSNFSVPNDGCSTYALTYNGLEEMESDLFQHIHLENNILFKRMGIDVN